MASGASLNRYGPNGGYPFFYVQGTGGIAIGQPLNNVNGTYDSGPIAVEAIGFSKWAFQLGGQFTRGWSVTIYGTIDPIAYVAWQANIQGLTTPPVVPASSWAKLPAPAEETGTGVSTNPMTATGVILPYNLSGLVAVRAVAVASSADAPLQAWAFAIP